MLGLDGGAEEGYIAGGDLKWAVELERWEVETCGCWVEGGAAVEGEVLDEEVEADGDDVKGR